MKKMMIFIVTLICILGIFTIVYTSNVKNKDNVINDNGVKKQNVDELYSEYISNYMKENNLEKQTDAINYWNRKLQDLVLPRKITFYKKGQKYSFDYGSNEFYKIIELNQKRCTDTLTTNKFFYPLPVEELKQNGYLLEYEYRDYQFAYFNLSEYITNITFEDGSNENFDVKTIFMAIGGFIEGQDFLGRYVGLSSTDEIL